MRTGTNLNTRDGGKLVRWTENCYCVNEATNLQLLLLHKNAVNRSIGRCNRRKAIFW